MHDYINSLHYLPCPHSHYESLAKVCIDHCCSSPGLICSTCEDRSHKGHLTVAFKELLKSVAFQDQQFSTVAVFQSICANEAACLSRLQEFKDTFLNSLEQTCVRVKMYYSRVYEQAFNICDMKIGNKFVGKIAELIDREDLQALNRYTAEVAKLYEPEQNCAQNRLEQCIYAAKEKMKSLSQQIALFSLDNKFKEINLRFPSQLFFSSSIRFQWSFNHPAKIHINGLIATQTNVDSTGQRFALMAPSINPSKPGRQTWSVKVRKLKGWIGVGMCLKKVILAADYKFNYTTIGHGSYLVSSNGFSWSHSDQLFNSVSKGFAYGVEDTIKVSYEHSLKTIKFQKVGKVGFLELKVVNIPEGDQFVPCVNLSTSGDEVEIVSHT